MTYLLDTHAFVWAVSAPERLGTQARPALEEAANTLILSAATAWELSTKVRLGEFAEAEPLVAQYPQILETLGAVELPVSSLHALRAGSLEWDHRDPFDRMLAAQAMIENLKLVTRDHAFTSLGGLELIW